MSASFGEQIWMRMCAFLERSSEMKRFPFNPIQPGATTPSEVKERLVCEASSVCLRGFDPIPPLPLEGLIMPSDVYDDLALITFVPNAFPVPELTYWKDGQAVSVIFVAHPASLAARIPNIAEPAAGSVDCKVEFAGSLKGKAIQALEDAPSLPPFTQRPSSAPLQLRLSRMGKKRSKKNKSDTDDPLLPLVFVAVDNATQQPLPYCDQCGVRPQHTRFGFCGSLSCLRWRCRDCSLDNKLEFTCDAHHAVPRKSMSSTLQALCSRMDSEAANIELSQEEQQLARMIDFCNAAGSDFVVFSEQERATFMEWAKRFAIDGLSSHTGARANQFAIHGADIWLWMRSLCSDLFESMEPLSISAGLDDLFGHIVRAEQSRRPAHAAVVLLTHKGSALSLLHQTYAVEVVGAFDPSFRVDGAANKKHEFSCVMAFTERVSVLQAQGKVPVLVVEPLQVLRGQRLSDTFLRQISDLCREKGVSLVVDERYSSVRCGKPFFCSGIFNVFFNFALVGGVCKAGLLLADSRLASFETMRKGIEQTNQTAVSSQLLLHCAAALTVLKGGSVAALCREQGDLLCQELARGMLAGETVSVTNVGYCIWVQAGLECLPLYANPNRLLLPRMDQTAQTIQTIRARYPDLVRSMYGWSPGKRVEIVSESCAVCGDTQTTSSCALCIRSYHTSCRPVVCPCTRIPGVQAATTAAVASMSRRALASFSAAADMTLLQTHAADPQASSEEAAHTQAPCMHTGCAQGVKLGRYCPTHMHDALGLRIAPSSIAGAGKGLFATRSFRKGEVVAVFTGRKRPISEKGGDSDILLSATHILDCAERRSGEARFANHNASRANTKLKIKGDDACLRATRRIASGEEIFLSYGDNYWN